MPRPRTARKWIDIVNGLVENQPSLTLDEIEDQLKKIAGDKPDYPSQATIKRIRQAHLKSGEDVRQQYRFVFWPESFDRGDLPWEAAPAIGEWLRTSEERPSVQLALRFWQVTELAPSIAFGERRRAASRLVMLDAAENTPERSTEIRLTEAFLLGRITELPKFEDLYIEFGSTQRLTATLAAAGIPFHRDPKPSPSTDGLVALGKKRETK